MIGEFDNGAHFNNLFFNQGFTKLPVLALEIDLRSCTKVVKIRLKSQLISIIGKYIPKIINNTHVVPGQLTEI